MIRRLVAVCMGVWVGLAGAGPAEAMVGPDAPARARSSAPGSDGGGSPIRPRQLAQSLAAVDRSTPRARWAWPLEPRPVVLAPFRAPTTNYGSGHRGIDVSGSAGRTVRAVAAGQVSFAGVIGGKPTVAVTHADGIRSTYEPVLATVTVGESVVVGQPIGVVAASGSHCATTCVHLGAIRGGTYLDPLLLLRSWRVRLLPLTPR
ncbi:MAG: peptidoglycan DD-metalloendopeptidase family protein [Nostocoides sp.]